MSKPMGIFFFFFFLLSNVRSFFAFSLRATEGMIETLICKLIVLAKVFIIIITIIMIAIIIIATMIIMLF